MSKGTNTNPVLDALRDCFDAFDPWGSAMSAHFDIAECLYRNGAQVPAAWEYRPSPMMSVGDPLEEDASFFAEQVELMMHQGQVSNLIHAGNVLARYCHLLEMEGHSY